MIKSIIEKLDYDKIMNINLKLYAIIGFLSISWLLIHDFGNNGLIVVIINLCMIILAKLLHTVKLRINNEKEKNENEENISKKN